MAINKTQQGIINAQAVAINDEPVSDAINSFLTDLEKELNVELSREEDSNIYIIVKDFINNIMLERYKFKAFVDGLNVFFDENKFDGYIAGSYSGVRQGLLTLGIFTDVKLINKALSQIQIILLGETINTDANKVLIAQNLHKFLPLTQTYNTDTTNLVSQNYNASTGQAITYNWYVGNVLSWKITITYIIDYEQAVEDYDFQTQIIDATNNIYNKLYSKLGKDFKVKDFYSLTRDVYGVSEVEVSVDTGNEVIEDDDIVVADTDMFAFNEIIVVGG